ncbi:MAG TPA: CoA transferase [Burkholderiaceae bacterium]|nr:CoA transferase [Burkholderiaceae bacterium]
MPSTAASSALQALWREAALPEASLDDIVLTGADPVLPSSFAVGAAAQAALGAAALAAAHLYRLRSGQGQRLTLDMADAAFDSCGWFAVDGRTPNPWDPLSGLYRCGPEGRGGWVRIHANFAHHRDGALRLLGLPAGAGTTREQVAAALAGWQATDFEEAAAAAGLVLAAVRSFDEWDRHPQAAALASLAPVTIRRIGDAGPRRWPALAPADRPLTGLRVLELTRILAGPVAGRTLAAYGADVMLVNGSHLPNIASIADTSRGKRSVLLDLREAADQQTLRRLAGEAQVFLQGYRPGGLARLGFGVDELARISPGIVCVSLSAYGHRGPWAARRGFDSLVQSATGFNVAEAAAAGVAEPRALPLQILDYCAGYLLAFGTQTALARQAHEGGSWHVQVSLAGIGRWLRGFERVADGFRVGRPDFPSRAQDCDSGFGRLSVLPHPVVFSKTPARWDRPSRPPGADIARW